MGTEHVIDTHCECIGATVRDCLGCKALVAGGPTRCNRCAQEGDPAQQPTQPRPRYRLRALEEAMQRLRRLGESAGVVNEREVRRVRDGLPDEVAGPDDPGVYGLVDGAFGCYYTPIEPDAGESEGWELPESTGWDRAADAGESCDPIRAALEDAVRSFDRDVDPSGGGIFNTAGFQSAMKRALGMFHAPSPQVAEAIFDSRADVTTASEGRRDSHWRLAPRQPDAGELTLMPQAAQERIEELEQQLARVTEERDQERSRRRCLEDDVRGLGNIAGAAETGERSSDAIRRVVRERDEAEIKLAEERCQIDDLSSSVKTLRGERDEARRLLDKLKESQGADSHAEAEALAHHHADQLNEATTRIRELEQDAANARDAANMRRDEHERLERLLDEAVDAVVEVTGDSVTIDRLGEHVRAVAERAVAWKRRMDEANAALEGGRRHREELERTNAELRQEVERLTSVPDACHRWEPLEDDPGATMFPYGIKSGTALVARFATKLERDAVLDRRKRMDVLLRDIEHYRAEVERLKSDIQLAAEGKPIKATGAAPVAPVLALRAASESVRERLERTAQGLDGLAHEAHTGDLAKHARGMARGIREFLGARTTEGIR